MLMNLVARDRGLGVGIVQIVCVLHSWLSLQSTSILQSTLLHTHTHRRTGVRARARAGQVSIFMPYEYLKMSRIIKMSMYVSEWIVWIFYGIVDTIICAFNSELDQ